jgi:hypothetical protein
MFVSTGLGLHLCACDWVLGNDMRRHYSYLSLPYAHSRLCRHRDENPAQLPPPPQQPWQQAEAWQAQTATTGLKH